MARLVITGQVYTYGTNRKSFKKYAKDPNNGYVIDYDTYSGTDNRGSLMKNRADTKGRFVTQRALAHARMLYLRRYIRENYGIPYNRIKYSPKIDALGKPNAVGATGLELKTD